MSTNEIGCTCGLCTLGRDLRAEPPNMERVNRGVDWLFEHGAAQQASLYYLMENVERLVESGRAPRYLVRAAAHVNQEMNRASRTFNATKR